MKTELWCVNFMQFSTNEKYSLKCIMLLLLFCFRMEVYVGEWRERVEVWNAIKNVRTILQYCWMGHAFPFRRFSDDQRNGRTNMYGMFIRLSVRCNLIIINNCLFCHFEFSLCNHSMHIWCTHKYALGFDICILLLYISLCIASRSLSITLIRFVCAVHI